MKIFGIHIERVAPTLQTNRWILLRAGAIYDGSRRSALITAIRISIIIVSGLLFALKVIIREDYDDILEIVICIHMVILYSSLFVMMMTHFVHSAIFFEMEANIKSGFYHYRAKFTNEQLMVSSNANRYVRLTTYFFCISCIIAVVSNFLYAPIFQGNWSLPFPMWFPFEINSWYRYLPVMTYIWITYETVATNGCMNLVIYTTMALHLIGQFKILILSVQEIDTLAKQEASSDDKESKVSSRIKECVQHHLILIRFFDDFQRYYNVILLVAAFSLALLFCTLGFIIISKEYSLSKKAPVMLLLIPELAFPVTCCILGQMIADAADEVGLAVYNLRWYNLTPSVQRDLLMILVGCKKTRQLTAMGLHEFSIKGLSEILQATFTYLNMLIVLGDE